MIHREFTRRALHDVRSASEFAHARPAYAAGLRAAIATVAPLVVQSLLPAGAATWMSLAGLNGALVDRGGPYRMRAAMMLGLALASAFAVFVGSIVGGHLVLATVVTFVVAMACGLARAWVEVGPGFGVTILVTFAIALALPSATPADAAMRAVYIVAGGLWAMLIAIVLWPLRPYRPVRLRVSECYRAIARYAEAASAELAGGSLDQAALTSHVVAVRASIDSARTALAVSRRARASETRRGETLLVLHEIADQLFAHLIALIGESDLVLVGSSAAGARDALDHTLRNFAETMRAVADAIPSERGVPRLDVRWTGESLRPFNASIGEIATRMGEYAVTAAVTTSSLNTGASTPAVGGTIDVAEPPPEPALFSVEAILHPGSVVLHHALRIAIVTTAAVVVTMLLGLNHGYWVTLTVVVIMQPFAAATRLKAMQRVAGTILGGVVAAGLSALFQSSIAVLVLIALFTMACVALLPLNYGAYAVFGTPAFVLLAEASVGDWHLAGLRIVNTLIGGALALVGSRLLWPGDEWSRLPELAAEAIRANDALLQQAIAAVANGSGDIGMLREGRQRIARAALEADTSFQRLVSEHRGPADALEPIMAFLVYSRRIAASTMALALAGDQPEASDQTRRSLQPFADAAHGVLVDLADAVAAGRPPAPFPAAGSIDIPATVGSLVQQRATRLARQLKLIHDSVERWMDPGAEPTVQTGEFRARRAGITPT